MVFPHNKWVAVSILGHFEHFGILRQVAQFLAILHPHFWPYSHQHELGGTPHCHSIGSFWFLEAREWLHIYLTLWVPFLVLEVGKDP